MPHPRRRAAAWWQRTLQALSLGLFLWLLWRTAFPLVPGFLPVDAFIRLDPSLAVGLPLAARAWIPALGPGLIVLLICLVAGRIFCGYVCPMGATLDMTRWLMPSGVSKIATAADTANDLLPLGKYLVLAGLLGAAALGVNLFFWSAPLPLVTRFYNLVLDPLRLLLAQAGLAWGQGLWEGLGLTTLAHAQVEPRRYDTLFFTTLLFVGILGMEKRWPRFWCRCLCPAGALLSLVSFRPWWRRRVHYCIACGQCVQHCPTGAIAPDGQATTHGECLTCRRCVDICPVRGVRFAFAGFSPARGETVFPPARPTPLALPSRRAFLTVAGAGVCMGALHYAELRTVLTSGKGLLQDALAVRPPGALPEAEFLARCVRCGQCMKVCPSNGLQPAWLDCGAGSLFSPMLVARRGACEPDCHACGQVCPSVALRPLPLAQKHWAKIGTAVIVPGRCVAWAMDKRCVVCQEVCPYGAIELVRREGYVAPVPEVRAQRCFGCGYCENHCPVHVSAIVVEAFHALRLSTGDYVSEAKAQGLHLEPGKREAMPERALPPGVLPPGFTE